MALNDPTLDGCERQAQANDGIWPMDTILLQAPELIVAPVAVPLMNIFTVALIGARNVKALAAVFGRDYVVSSSLRDELPELIGTAMAIILGNIGPVARVDAFHIHALVAILGGDKKVSKALVRQGPALIRTAMTFPLLDVCPIVRGDSGYIETFPTVLGFDLIGAAGGKA